MASYVVKSGDTLSGIASQYGIPYQQITGYSSGNPNLIRPGEVLTIPDKPGATPAPAAAPAVSTPQTVAQPTSYSQPQSSGGLTADILRSQFGFNDSNVINNILNNPSERARYEKEAGISTGSSFGLPNQPTVDLNGIYSKVIEDSQKALQPEIDANKSAVNAIQARLTAKQQAQAKAEAEVNDNPYYGEATRTGRIQQLRDQAEKDQAIDVSQLTLAQNQSLASENKLTQAKADAQVKVNIASQKYNIQSQQYQNNLQMFNNLLSNGLLENASAADIAQIATTTGMSTSMINSVIATTKKKNTPAPQLQVADDGTNQYVVAIDPTTGNVINKQVIASSAKKATAGASSDAKEEAAFYSAVDKGVKQLQSGESWGNVWNRIHTQFPYIDAAVLDQLLGVEWRDPGAYQSYKTRTGNDSSNSDLEALLNGG